MSERALNKHQVTSFNIAGDKEATSLVSSSTNLDGPVEINTVTQESLIKVACHTSDGVVSALQFGCDS